MTRVAVGALMASYCCNPASADDIAGIRALYGEVVVAPEPSPTPAPSPAPELPFEYHLSQVSRD